MGSGIPMQRGGHPEEVARAILSLLSDAASYTTGSLGIRVRRSLALVRFHIDYYFAASSALSGVQQCIDDVVKREYAVDHRFDFRRVH